MTFLSCSMAFLDRGGSTFVRMRNRSLPSAGRSSEDVPLFKNNSNIISKSYL